MKRTDAFLAEVPKLNLWMIVVAMGLIAGTEAAFRITTGVLLPDMQGNVGATIDQLSWVLIAYNTGYICSLGLSAGIVRSFGLRKLWLWCIGLYALGAVLSFLSHDLTELLVARSIMGLGGGVFIARSILFMREMFDHSQSARAITVFNIALIIPFCILPAAMGAVTDASRWQNAMLLDLPFVAIGFGVIYIFMPARIIPKEQRPPADYLGVALLLAGVIPVQVAFSRGERDLWFESPRIVALLITGAVCFTAFLWWDSREGNHNPVLHIRTILSQGMLRAAFTLIPLLGACMGCALYVIPQYLRIVQSYDAYQTALFSVPYVLGIAAGINVILWVLLPRFNPAQILVLGLVLFFMANLGFVYMWTAETPGNDIVLLLVLSGFGIGTMLAATSLLSTAPIEKRYLQEAVTSYYFIRQFGSSLGVTAAAVLIDRRMTFHSSRMLDQANRLNPTVETVLRGFSGLIAQRAGGASVPTPGNLELFRGIVVKQTMLLAFIDISFSLAAVAIVGVALVGVMRWHQSREASRVAAPAGSAS